MTIDYEDHTVVAKLLQRTQDAEQDMRQAAREARLFLHKRDGQWDPYWIESRQRHRRQRGTYDMVTPIVNQIAGTLDKADFNLQVRPSGGSATKKVAETYDGLIRNIENISNADRIFSAAGRNMITSGLDGWNVRTKFVEEDSFDQDLVIERITNFLDRVWFDDNSLSQDHSDSEWCFLLHVFTLDEYIKQFGKERDGVVPTASSVPEGKQGFAFWRVPDDQVITAEFYYAVYENKEIVLMSNGKVYEVNDDFEKVQDELLQFGVEEKRRRTVKTRRFYVRKMDGSGWLGEPQRTVFKQIPIVPTYGNFNVFDNKIIYHGVVEKLLDPQRAYNFAKSKELEEVALGPLPKLLMTPEQAKGFTKELQDMNVNKAPILRYNPDPEAGGLPQYMQPPPINAGLINLSDSMAGIIQQQAGLFDANMGNNPGLQSGKAIEKLQDKGEVGTVHYFSAQEVAITQTAKLLIEAIPEVYDTERQVRILKEDSSFEMATLNQPIKDEQTGEMITLNDLSQGTYDVTCSAGPAFKNSQDQVLASMLEIAQYLPETLTAGADLLFASMTGPGSDLMAERMRLKLLEEGVIPEEQMSDEELQKAEEAAQQEQPPDPMMVAAEAEMKKADADMAKVELEGAKVELDREKLGLEREKLSLKAEGDFQKIELEEIKLQLSAQQQAMANQIAEFKVMEESRKQDSALLKEAAETFKILREGSGAEAVLAPEVADVIMEQAGIVSEQQEEL